MFVFVVLYILCVFFFFFFFKQKTAYEMRISDWSSDVCSSDLQNLFPRHAPRPLDGDLDGRRSPLGDDCRFQAAFRLDCRCRHCVPVSHRTRGRHRERGPPSHDAKVRNKAYLGVTGKAPSADNWPGHSLVTGRPELIEITARNLLKYNGLQSNLA